MKKIFILFFVLISFISYADEGMWILSLINKKYDDIKKQGFKLTPEDIYNINKASLKDAIVGLADASRPLSFFCSGSIVSSKGLVFTNHHCGYSYIQKHSTLEHNYLENGFWAKTYNEELPNEGLCVSVLLQIIDVTGEVLTSEIDTMSSLPEKQQMISYKIREIENRYADEPYLATVVDMFGGNQYLLFLYETYYDVRLVGTPPSSIGKFGGDTDNWMWPRHTGDFCIFRIYTASDGKPAYYSKDNVPFQPKRYLKVNKGGVKKDDYVMIIGFPGTTNRYYTSYEVQSVLDITAPYTVMIRREKLRILDEQMSKSQKIKLQYASKYSECSNYYKYYIGQKEQLLRNNVIEKKKAQEEKFLMWINQDTNRIKEYGWILPYIRNYYEKKEYKELKKFYVFLEEAVFQGSELIYFPLTIYPYLDQLSLTPKDSLQLVLDPLKQVVDNFYKDFEVETDKRLFVGLMQMLNKEFSEEYHLPFMETVKKKYKGDIQKYADDLYKKSVYADKDKLWKVLSNPNEKSLEKLYKDDFFFILQNAAMWYMIDFLHSDSLQEAKRLWIKAQMKMYPDSVFYPDANGTIRLTYGTVKDYYPRDAVRYDYFTTIDGIIEKEDSTSDEFIVPKKLKDLYASKDYKPYSENETLPVCFLTTNDITGGNSGSAVMDAYGNLIGIAFDGNWEAMSGDINYEPQFQRTICVDIRYVLFVVDKFANAKHLINELDIVK